MRNCKLCGRGLACVLMLGVASAAQANIVFENTPNNGWFTPFNASNAANVKYGDSGWIGTAQPSYTLTQIDLGVVSQNGTFEGTTDIKFTLNDGDPSGLVFGTAAELYSTTITGVALPSGAGPNFFTLTIPLPNIATLGGFNNVGWSIGLENYNFDGEFGFPGQHRQRTDGWVLYQQRLILRRRQLVAVLLRRRSGDGSREFRCNDPSGAGALGGRLARSGNDTRSASSPSVGHIQKLQVAEKKRSSSFLAAWSFVDSGRAARQAPVSRPRERKGAFGLRAPSRRSYVTVAMRHSHV
jgi:hypothetical protein